MSWKNRIPEGWEWKGIAWKGSKEFPVYVFKNTVTGQSKGFSGWIVQPPTKEKAVSLLREYLGMNEVNL